MCPGGSGRGDGPEEEGKGVVACVDAVGSEGAALTATCSAEAGDSEIKIELCRPRRRKLMGMRCEQ